MRNWHSDPGGHRASWLRIKELFHAAESLSKTERAVFLSAQCRDDTETREAVERLLAHASAGSFLDAPAWRPTVSNSGAFSPGDVINDRFRILRLLGRGGMGEVYVAFDSEVGDAVALKTLGPEFARNAQMLQRLKTEIQLSRRVTHPNICRVFDLGRTKGDSDEKFFLTMEFIDGPNLAEYLQCHKTTAEEALRIVSQLCQGLNAAHESNVIHRDLKPSNVVLELRGERSVRAVITDFGIAKSVVDHADLPVTRTGEVPGTIAYMAPEVLSGSASSKQSDIYALGLIALEIRTGSTQLRPEGVGSGIDRLESRWRKAILKCLSPDPTKRFASSRALEHSLKGADKSTIKRSLLISVVGAIVALVIGVALLVNWRPHALGNRTVVVTPLTNLTRDPRLDGLTEVLREQLGQSPRIRLWSQDRLSAVLREMRINPQPVIEPAVWREISLRENANLVLFWNVTQLADTFVLSARVENVGRNPARPEREWDHTERAKSIQNLLDAVHGTSLWMRHLSGETEVELSAHDKLPQDMTTSSWEALDLYHRAEVSKQAGDPEKAIIFLEQALLSDPSFAMAHARLGDILMSLRRDREALVHWATAIDASHKQNLTSREEYRIRGIYGIDSGDLSSAEGALLRWLQEYPLDYLPAYYLAYVYRMQGKLSESLRLLQEARTRNGDAYYVLSSFAQTYLAQGNYQETLTICTRLRQEHHSDAADQFEGVARLLLGDFGRAELHFRNMTNSATSAFHSRGYLLLARAEAEQGHIQQAAAELGKGIDFDRDNNLRAARAEKLLALAYLQRSDRELARALALEAVRAYPSPETCTNAGTILARVGFITLAASQGSCVRSLNEVPRFQAMQMRLQGEIALARGEIKNAVRLLEQAAALEPPLNVPDYLIRALALSGDLQRTRMLCKEVLRRPGILWLNAETALPGIQREITDESKSLFDVEGAKGKEK